MSGAWQRLVALLDRRETGTSMAVVRALVGACVARTVLSVWWAGAAPVVWFNTEDGGYRRLAGSYLVRWAGGATPAQRTR
ncbi:MAG TPA: hypothetical protein PKA64_26480, partial [Myxococcota bacterium]|nr:hypothetical protein [Myxococcota bacterium]